ncbi:Elongator subunit elp4 [Blyttiomyces sp. JEL0837]|nr:Elongator subunit elp4 [Blyttiomyces sp. JEL0837]
MSFRKRVPTPPSSSSTTPSSSSSTLPTTPTFQTTRLPRSTKISPHNGHLVTSTGILSLDEVLGGGLPSGTLLLLQEDRHTGYASLIYRYFIAQGIVGGHAMCVASADEVPNGIVGNLMAVVGVEDDGSSSSKGEDDKDKDEDVDGGMVGGFGQGRSLGMGSLRDPRGDRMSIAWRYQGLPKFSSSVSGGGNVATGGGTKGDGPYCHLFDLTKKMPEATITAASKMMALLDVQELITPETTAAQTYQKLFDNLKEMLAQGAFSNNSSTPPGGIPNFLRIAIQSVGSFAWGKGSGDVSSCRALFKFIISLRALLRDTRAVCMVTIPAYLYGDHHGVSGSPFIKSLQHACDGVIEIESFTGSQRQFGEEFTSDYHGFLHPHKLPTLNTLTPATRIPITELYSLAFRVRRKRFYVETFHLPPEKETSGGQTGSQGQSGQGSDGGSGKKGGGGGGGSSGGKGNSAVANIVSGVDAKTLEF